MRIKRRLILIHSASDPALFSFLQREEDDSSLLTLQKKKTSTSLKKKKKISHTARSVQGSAEPLVVRALLFSLRKRVRIKLNVSKHFFVHPSFFYYYYYFAFLVFSKPPAGLFCLFLSFPSLFPLRKKKLAACALLRARAFASCGLRGWRGFAGVSFFSDGGRRAKTPLSRPQERFFLKNLFDCCRILAHDIFFSQSSFFL